ncbi:MAG: alpha/beta fold hydrolase [Alphaproteobacteria bacterium]
MLAPVDGYLTRQDDLEIPEHNTILGGAAWTYPARRIARFHMPGLHVGITYIGGINTVRADSGAEPVAAALMGLPDALRPSFTCFDYGGFGKSGGELYDLKFGQMLDDARSVVEATAGPQILVGTSMGGFIALKLAQEEHARKLAAAESGSKKGILGEKRKILAVVPINAAWNFSELPNIRQVCRHIVTNIRHMRNGGRPLPSGLVREFLAEGRHHCLRTESSPGGEQRFPFGCPVLAIQGGADPLVKVERSKELMRRIDAPATELYVFPEGNHHMTNDQVRHLVRNGLPAVAKSLGQDLPWLMQDHAQESLKKFFAAAGRQVAALFAGQAGDIPALRPDGYDFGNLRSPSVAPSRMPG